MDGEDDNNLNSFNNWIENFEITLSQFNSDQLVRIFDTFLKHSTPSLKYHITKNVDQLKVDFTEILPPEILELIFSYLEIKDIDICCIVNRHWNTVVSHCAQMVWRKACITHGLNIEKLKKLPQNVSDKLKEVSGTETWKSIYQRVRQKLSPRENCISDIQFFAFDCHVPIGQTSPTMFYRDNIIGIVGEGLNNVKLIHLDNVEFLQTKLLEHATHESYELNALTDITSLKFKDDLLVAGCSNGHIAIWRMSSHKLINYYPAIPSAVKDISFCVNSNVILIKGNCDRLFQVRKLNDRYPMRTIQGVNLTQTILQQSLVDSLFHKKGETMLITLSSAMFQVISIWPPFSDPDWFTAGRTIAHVSEICIKSYSHIRPQMVCNGLLLAVTHTKQGSGTTVAIHSLKDFSLVRSINNDEWTVPKDRWKNLNIGQSQADWADIIVCSVGKRFMLLRRTQSAVYFLMETPSLQLIAMIDLMIYCRPGEEIALPQLSSSSVYNTHWFEDGFVLDEHNFITLILAYKNSSTVAKFDIGF